MHPSATRPSSRLHIMYYYYAIRLLVHLPSSKLAYLSVLLHSAAYRTSESPCLIKCNILRRGHLFLALQRYFCGACVLLIITFFFYSLRRGFIVFLKSPQRAINVNILIFIIAQLQFRSTIVIIIIIKGHSLRRACLQPATNTQNSKPRPPTTNAKEN